MIADSPSLPRTHLAFAIAFAREHGIPLRMVQTPRWSVAEYVRNDGARCFHCKDELFRCHGAASLPRPASPAMAYGRNRDDSGDSGPASARRSCTSRCAASEAGWAKRRSVLSPMRCGLNVWDKPCLGVPLVASGVRRPVTAEALRQVEEAEEPLLALGFRQVRVRHHGELARIEIERSELARALSRGDAGAHRSGRARGRLHLRDAGYGWLSFRQHERPSSRANRCLPQPVVPSCIVTQVLALLTELQSGHAHAFEEVARSLLPCAAV